MILQQRSAEIDGCTGHPEIVRQASEDRAVDILLDALQNFFVALVPAVDDDAGAVGIDAKAFQRQQAAFQGPQRRHVGLRHDQDHSRHAQDRAPLR